ncbi:MAG: STAS domain-containing protein [Candidatus Latescibacterota bacterium]
MFEITWGSGKKVLLIGRFDAHHVDMARDFFLDIDESCTVDCSGLTNITSSGLGVLLSAQRRLAEAGHGMKLIKMKQHVKDRFKVAGLDTIFDIE